MPRLFRMAAGSLADSGQLLPGEFCQELPRGLRRRGQVERRLGRRRRRSSRRLRVEVPHARMARRIRMRIAGMDGVHNFARQVPGPPAGLGFGNGQLDNGRVAKVVARLGADHKRHHVAALDWRFEALSSLSVAGILCEPPGPMAPCARTFRRVRVSAHNRPLDAVAALGIAHRHAGPDAHATPQGAAPADGHIAIRQGVHGDSNAPGCADRPRGPARSAGLAPNHGIKPADQPRTSGTPAIESTFVLSSSLGGGASAAVLAFAGICFIPAARTKKPYSGARIGPCSRSAARKEKLPDLVHTVTMVRATSSGWA